MAYEVIYGVYATPGKQYATGTNPFGRDQLGFIWASSGAEAVLRFAEREGLDAADIEY